MPRSLQRNVALSWSNLSMILHDALLVGAGLALIVLLASSTIGISISSGQD